MQARCRPGDLAIVIDAFHRCNIGSIVKVLAAYDGNGILVFPGNDVVWLVESSHPMTWTVGWEYFHHTQGPVPDRFLKPIRGTFGKETPVAAERVQPAAATKRHSTAAD